MQDSLLVRNEDFENTSVGNIVEFIVNDDTNTYGPDGKLILLPKSIRGLVNSKIHIEGYREKRSLVVNGREYNFNDILCFIDIMEIQGEE